MLQDRNIGALYQSSLEGDWPALLETVREASGGCFAAVLNFTRNASAERQRVAFVSQDTNARFARALDEFSGRKNPFDGFKVGAFSDAPITLSQLRKSQAPQSWELLETICAFDFSDVARCVLRDTDDQLLVLNIYRDTDQGAWSDRDLTLLSSLQFHVRSALDLAAKVASGADAFSDLLSLLRTDEAFMVMDSQGHEVVRHNWSLPAGAQEIRLPSYASRALAESGSLTCQFEYLKTRERRFDQALVRSISGSSERLLKVGPMSVNDDNLLLLVRREDLGNDRAEFLAGLDQLTDSESRIFDGIRAGYSERALADRLGLALNTVKFHRKNLYRKLQLSSARELVLLAGRFL
jgi:DNA-binding CsgD family transcriptional regulator